MQHLSWTGTLGAYLNPLFLTALVSFLILAVAAAARGFSPRADGPQFNQPHPTLRVPDWPKPGDWTGALAVEPRRGSPCSPLWPWIIFGSH